MAEDQGLDRSLDMKISFNNIILGDFAKFTTNSFDHPRKKLSEIKNNAKELGDAIKEIIDPDKDKKQRRRAKALRIRGQQELFR